MNYTDSFSQSPWPERLRAVFEITMVSGLVSSFLASEVLAVIFGRDRLKLTETDAGFLVTFLLLESAVTFFILRIFMKAREETLRALGLRWRHWKKHVLTGFLVVPLLLVINSIIGAAFHAFLPEYALEKNPLTEMIHSPRQLVLFIIASIIAGGIKEEMQRAFILRRFRHHLGGAGVGLIVWSLVFGAEHYVQGIQGMCVAAILGFVFGVLYLMRGNLIGPITAHSAYNTLTLLIYWFVIRGA